MTPVENKVAEAVREIRFKTEFNPETRSVTKTGYLTVSKSVEIAESSPATEQIRRDTDEMIRRGILKLLYGEVAAKIREIADNTGQWERI